jgi:hypothetical protein
MVVKPKLLTRIAHPHEDNAGSCSANRFHDRAAVVEPEISRTAPDNLMRRTEPSQMSGGSLCDPRFCSQQKHAKSVSCALQIPRDEIAAVEILRKSSAIEQAACDVDADTVVEDDAPPKYAVKLRIGCRDIERVSVCEGYGRGRPTCKPCIEE